MVDGQRGRTKLLGLAGLLAQAQVVAGEAGGQAVDVVIVGFGGV